MAKMWAGRTAGVTDPVADDFNSSIRFDSRMYREDITGSMAHAAMLGAQHILPQADADAIIDAPDAPTYVTLDFEQGKPVALDGEKMSAKDIILKLNKIGGANGIGILDIVENRLVGMKCRGVYETPGGAILYKAHSVLETLCLDKMTMHEKQKLAVTFGELVYNGQWFTPLREALSAFVTKTQEHVTGTVRLKLYKGNMINAGVWSPYSLYSEEIATFGESDYNQADAAGFIQLYGLPIAVQAKVDGKSM